MSVESDPTSTPRRDLSIAIVRWYSDRFGRGPTQAKSYIEDDHALIILGEVQTTVERTLASQGHGDLVRELRRTVKAVFRDEISAVVETATGRKVVAVHSDHDPATDTSAYVFLFEPDAGDS